MAEDYFEMGEALDGALPYAFKIESAREMWQAVQLHRDFSLIEARKLQANGAYSELLIVDVECDRIPPNNKPGLKYRERLALSFYESMELMPEVHALRVGFPLTMHQNDVGPGMPASLCLYFEAWSVVRRSWTAQKHLKRILWWLEETSLEKLHRSDQPLEQLYFSARKDLILPHDFHERIKDQEYLLTIESRLDKEGGRETLIGTMRKAAETDQQKINASCFVYELSPIVHGRIEAAPRNLGQLSDSLESRMAPFIKQLSEEIKSRAEGKLLKADGNYVILILSIPICREQGGAVERYEHRGYFLPLGLAELGVKVGALDRCPSQNGKPETYVVRRDLGVEVKPPYEWRDVETWPMDILQPFTPEYARVASGISSAGPKGALAGLGALGSELFNLWSRSGWGQWILIDHDYVKPHNLARHSAYQKLIGCNKAIATLILDKELWGETGSKAQAIPEKATGFNIPAVQQALVNAELIIDATTTLEYPREHASRNELPRGISVFLTPSGNGAVILAEDAGRSIRLDTIEAQYYRAIINHDWGKAHLEGNLGHLWTGGGCRDLSAIISGDLITMHAGNLGRQIRRQAELPTAAAKIWHYDENSGAVKSDSICPQKDIRHKLSDIEVVWDQGLRAKVRDIRDQALPQETGGVLVGYFDLTLGKVYVVDVLHAPPDSQGDLTGFSRGKQNLVERIAEIQRRTAHIVGYIGEWHSHPPGFTSSASAEDLFQIIYLAQELNEDGLPALMLIVGESDESWYHAKVY